MEQTIAGVCALALVFYPLVALITRRLHDLGLSGWWQLALWGALLALCLTKSLWAFFIFELPLLALFMLPGQRQSNRYGPPPD